MSIGSALKSKFPGDICDALLAAYKEIEENFFIQKWKATELDAGHFVEASRRLIEQELFGTHTALGKGLPNFNDTELRRYENSAGEESLRILIPRILKSIYNVRNKRGIGHLGLISANEMDSTLILYSVKWVLAEFVRLATGADPNATQGMIDSIVERRIGVLWKVGGIQRILEYKMPTKDQILVLLFDSSPKSDAELRQIIEYKRTSDFKKILKSLHVQRLIEYSPTGQCLITPRGLPMAETILLKYLPK
jgi:hypothetical protein